ncbi:MAG: hypothetical protein HY960_11515 [Ignavibacteriae bacterium]|nr:hypothetical protein [Ignavibacteriota bacterium]
MGKKTTKLKEQTLWNVFTEKANATQQAMVGNLIRRAEPLLDCIRDTFPTYTLWSE